MAELGKRLQDIRKKTGFTQEQVAGFLGVTQAYISQIEKGERQIQVDLFEKMAALYGVDAADVENEREVSPIRFAFRTQDIDQNDLAAIANISRIAVNERFMTRLLENDNGRD
ncbi:helix-turn-helix domain-containing protein [Candidatus Weimeria sp. HCP3S3_B5]|uniref:helix-turn-helix domain-containing protein n=1 Tax=Candidatus Weimeria sp. HCP3S3_B5 TaxID=3438871 RepID=UPI003F88795F